MRKQTKVVAVASAAALLAIGASMTSFAATGWVEENGEWFYYDKDGYAVSDEWKKSGDNWYWLDSELNGAMATDKLVEDGNNTYYVDSNGVMVTNTWVKVVNEDQDEDTDPAEYRYYYMQANGKAYKSDNFSKKTIDGKKYAFDSEGKMLYGWVDSDNNALMAGEEDWKEATYYFGGWEDGSMKTGWQKINVYNGFDNADEDADYWFYFGSNGVKRVGTSDAKKTVRINSKNYAFTPNGEMHYKWLMDASMSDASTSVSSWKYFNSAEDGARQTKGWFKVVPKAAFDEEMSGDGNDEAQWYYADGNGSLYKSAIKKIKGKYYAFDQYGSMLSGLVYMSVDDDAEITVHAQENADRTGETVLDADYLDDLKAGKTNVVKANATLYYFGDADNEDSDGSMKTGNVNVSLDGSNYVFNFATAGGADSRGAGKTGATKGVYYKYGMKMTASSDDKYKAADITVDDDGDILTFISNSDLRDTVEEASYELYNKDKTSETNIKYYDFTTVKDGKIVVEHNYYLIGTNGKIKKNANGVRNGDDWYFFSNSEGKITYYAEDKNLINAFKQNNTKYAN